MEKDREFVSGGVKREDILFSRESNAGTSNNFLVKIVKGKLEGYRFWINSRFFRKTKVENVFQASFFKDEDVEIYEKAQDEYGKEILGDARTVSSIELVECLDPIEDYGKATTDAALAALD